MPLLKGDYVRIRLMSNNLIWCNKIKLGKTKILRSYFHQTLMLAIFSYETHYYEKSTRIIKIHKLIQQTRWIMTIFTNKPSSDLNKNHRPKIQIIRLTDFSNQDENFSTNPYEQLRDFDDPTNRKYSDKDPWAISPYLDQTQLLKIPQLK